jgi:HEAT repeat protein
MDSGLKVEGTGPVVGDNSNVVGQEVSPDNPTQTTPPVTSPSVSDIPIQNLDSRLQDTLRNFPTMSNSTERSTAAMDLSKLADSGVPKPQIATALGEMYRDETSVNVKTDILSALGDLDDPSAFDQIVPALDPHQPDEIHRAAIEALDSLDDKRAIPLIQPFLNDRDEDVRDAARSATDSLNN